MRSIYEKIALAVLMLLALSNLIFLILTLQSGPIIGFIAATAVAIHWWKRRDSMILIIMAIIWILFHIYELVMMGTSSLPVLFYLNLLLPFLLLYCGLKEKKHKH